MRKHLFVVSIFLTVIAFSSLLSQYALKEDNSFSFAKVSESKQLFGVTLVSQTWKGIPWSHTLQIFFPSKISSDSAVLLISGGNTNSKGSQSTNTVASMIANNIETIVAVLYAVPNQPLFGSLREDELIAHTIVKAIEEDDYEWIALLPMVKSAVKAMDAVQMYLKEVLKTDIKDFVLTGASKRGWTTWLTAGVLPERVKGIIPIVFDNLNIVLQMKHQLEVFGSFSEMIKPYTSRNLVNVLIGEDEKALEVLKIIDPYYYLENLKMPTLIINGSNDRYWTTDSAKYYFYDLKSPKWILYVPNAEHNLDSSPAGVERLRNSIVSFFKYLNGEISYPNLRWDFKKENNKLKVSWESDKVPKSVILWEAESESLDFRNSVWKDKEIQKNSVEILKDSKNKAIFVEFIFVEFDYEFSVCTTVEVF